MKSGLQDALETLDDVKGIGLVRFTARDVVRHDLVTRLDELLPWNWTPAAPDAAQAA